jgi:hypothetical protein
MKIAVVLIDLLLLSIVVLFKRVSGKRIFGAFKGSLQVQSLIKLAILKQLTEGLCFR